MYICIIQSNKFASKHPQTGNTSIAAQFVANYKIINPGADCVICWDNFVNHKIFNVIVEQISWEDFDSVNLLTAEFFFYSTIIYTRKWIVGT